MLEPAHGSRRTVSQYENPVIQNWPRLRDISQVSQRFDVIEVNGVEEVSFIAEEPGGQPGSGTQKRSDQRVQQICDEANDLADCFGDDLGVCGSAGLEAAGAATSAAAGALPRIHVYVE